jgi:hypothetical protein
VKANAPPIDRSPVPAKRLPPPRPAPRPEHEPPRPYHLHMPAGGADVAPVVVCTRPEEPRR